MSLLAVGLSHRTAPVSLLEAFSVAPVDVPKTLHELTRSEHVGEALVLSTCNRVEIYVDVDKFHGGLFDVTAVLARHAGTDVSALGDHLYVHYEDAAVHHLFRVAAGLDSMVVGESQILGQLRTAYAVAVAEQTVGRLIHELAQRALSAGKRAHAETGIDKAGASVVSLALDAADATLDTVAGRSAVVVGAGSMGALSGATLRRRGVGDLVIANRTAANAARLAATLSARAVGLDDLERVIADADLLISSTGSTSLVVPVDLLERAVAGRAGRPLVILDIGLPRDVDPAAAELPGVTYVDLDALRDAVSQSASGADIIAATDIVTHEAGAYLGWQRAVEVAPTVAALRAQATAVVDAELARLDAKLPGLDARTRSEVAHAVRRTVSTLLHAPTVRVKQLAESPGGDVYAEALRELFGLAPAAVDSVTAVDASDPPETRS